MLRMGEDIIGKIHLQTPIVKYGINGFLAFDVTMLSWTKTGYIKLMRFSASKRNENTHEIDSCAFSQRLQNCTTFNRERFQAQQKNTGVLMHGNKTRLAVTKGN
jgi:hypothetical protein